MKLFMVHVGFYDSSLGEGIYESHINYFVVAKDPHEAKQKTLKLKEFKNMEMHIDGIKEISSVEGYRVILEKDSSSKVGKILSYDESKNL